MRPSCLQVLFVSFLFLSSLYAHDYVPGEPQKNPILLKGGHLYTINQGLLKDTDILFEQGRITQIGKNLTLPPHTEIIDISGKYVYPGLFDSYSLLGMTEIGAVRATNDMAEVGEITPEVQSHMAYNPDSEIIPTTRSNGITTALVVPMGKLVNGRSSLIALDGWTKEDALIKPNVGIHLTWPPANVVNSWWQEKSEEEQQQEKNKKLKMLYQTFEEAKAYFNAKKANPLLPKDTRWEAMLPIFTQELLVFIYADDARQIQQALEFAETFSLKIVLVGGYESWKFGATLKAKNIPVILGKTLELPRREDEDYHLPFRVPMLLAEAGVSFSFSFATSGESSWDASWSARNIPFMAGYAVAFGLSYENALRAITLTPAEIFGVAHDLGSLEIGKKATLIVSDGDILNPLTHHICFEFIEGKKVDLDNKHKELYRKYKAKSAPK